MKSGIITGIASLVILFEGCLDNLIPRDKPKKRKGRHSKSPNKHKKRQRKKK